MDRGPPASAPIPSHPTHACTHSSIPLFENDIDLSIETSIDLSIYVDLQEAGFDAQLIPLFDPLVSPRNMALVAVKRGGGRADARSGTISTGGALCEPCVY